MSLTYKIFRWDPVITQKDTPSPMIYIKPDLKFLDYIRKNNNKILLKIEGTQTLYDNKMFSAIVNKCSDTPSCKPNLYHISGYYVCTLLDSYWYGYPNVGNEGQITIETSIYNKSNKSKKPKIQQAARQISPSTSVSSSLYIILILIVVLLFLMMKI